MIAHKHKPKGVLMPLAPAFSDKRRNLSWFLDNFVKPLLNENEGLIERAQGTGAVKGDIFDALNIAQSGRIFIGGTYLSALLVQLAKFCWDEKEPLLSARFGNYGVYIQMVIF